MIRIKQTDIDPKKLITKASLARRENVSQTEIDRQIKTGKWVIVRTSDNKELIHL